MAWVMEETRVECPQSHIHVMPAAEAGTTEVWAAPLGRAGLSQKLYSREGQARTQWLFLLCVGRHLLGVIPGTLQFGHDVACSFHTAEVITEPPSSS